VPQYVECKPQTSRSSSIWSDLDLEDHIACKYLSEKIRRDFNKDCSDTMEMFKIIIKTFDMREWNWFIRFVVNKIQENVSYI